MKVARLPEAVEKNDPCWITMADGTRLAATVWLPESARRAPVPAVLEYLPYRRRDFTASRDALHHPYFAGHGYASVRVDMRGSGDSQGVLRDEYLPQEQQDGIEVLRWIAAQPWCSGAVGMIGISWGGFNGLQIAAHRPAELQAVVSVASTDDRYADDVHHMGGCLLGDNLSWASVMFAYNSLPPDPLTVGDDWREMWMQRLQGSGLWLDTWLRHQRRDEYWRHASISEDYTALQCPVMLVGGWADGYSNAVFRMLEHLDVPRMGLIGPWAHKYPHLGLPGPAIGFLQECVRWWDRWLKGIDNGIDREPMLRAWMQHSVPPTTIYQRRPGHWVAENQWPSPRIEATPYRLTRRQLLAPGEAPDPGEPDRPTRLSIQSPLSVGLFAGKWCSYGGGPDLAHDQRQEDGGALVFETPPLGEGVQMLGAPRLHLHLSANEPIAMVAARVSDVAPDGAATRVTYGLLNLTHRDSHRDPEPLTPGQGYSVSVQLNEVGQDFPRGHRIRLSLSTSYWPLAWAPPRPVRLTVDTARCSLVLPLRTPDRRDGALRPFGPPEAARPLRRTLFEPENHRWQVVRDLASDTAALEVTDDRGRYRIDDHGLVVTSATRETYQLQGNDFLSLMGETRAERALRRGSWNVRTFTRTVLTADSENFMLKADLDAFEGDKRVYCQSWDSVIPRDLV